MSSNDILLSSILDPVTISVRSSFADCPFVVTDSYQTNIRVCDSLWLNIRFLSKSNHPFNVFTNIY